MGQIIDIEVDINANHWGYFELKICLVDGKSKPATQVIIAKDSATRKVNQNLFKPYGVPLTLTCT
jgi:hypothetical protein